MAPDIHELLKTFVGFTPQVFFRCALELFGIHVGTGVLACRPWLASLAQVFCPMPPYLDFSAKPQKLS